MSNSENSGNETNVSSENIFRITDELVHQIDSIKKIVLIMIVALVIAIPVSWHLAPLVTGTSFRIVGYVAIAIAVVFVFMGVRQWILFSKWTKKYKQYKELQRKIDADLEFEREGVEEHERNGPKSE